MPLIIGHRGGRHLWPENSLYGFRKLLELPVDGVEFDVHLTKPVSPDALLQAVASAPERIAAPP